MNTSKPRLSVCLAPELVDLSRFAARARGWMRVAHDGRGATITDSRAEGPRARPSYVERKLAVRAYAREIL